MARWISQFQRVGKPCLLNGPAGFHSSLMPKTYGWSIKEEKWRHMESRSSVQYVIGPDGEKMTRVDLPAPTVRRWVPRRKARVVAAVEGGLISREEACSQYAISHEEFEV
jgi:hypothetical protein